MIDGSYTRHLVTLRKMCSQSFLIILEGNLVFSHGPTNTLELLLFFSIIETTDVALGSEGVERM